MTTTNYQKQIESSMINELRDNGVKELRIEEYNRNGKCRTKIYTRLRIAVRRMIDFAQGEFPIYNGSEVTNMGYKMKISFSK